MRKTLLSLIIGGGLAVVLVTATFAAFSVLNPGWLRMAFAPRTPVPTSAAPGLTQVAGATVPPGSTPGAQDTPTPGPTVAPLPTVEGECGAPEYMTIALLGMDTREGDNDFRARTDAITLLRVNFANPSAAMLSIPRDLYVPLPGLEDQGIDQSRINTAYLYGEIYNVAGGGPAEFKHTVELNFGIRVDRYVLINFAAFKQTVDALGGIDVYVPKAIYDDEFPADDDGGTIIFEVPAGLVHMDGATALRYSRTRHQDDDYHRVQRQQDVLLAIRDRLIQPQVIPQIPALVAAMGNAGRTDLNPQEMAALACMGPKIDKGAIEALPIDATMVLPWTTPTGGRVSIPNRDVIAPLVQEFLNVGHSQVAASPL